MTQTALTREQVLSMEAGEELNDLIAEKVMGWHAKSKKWGGECDEYADHWHDGESFVCECEFFNPSIDISEAWEALEKVCNHDKWMLYKISQNDEDGVVKYEITLLEIFRGVSKHVRAVRAPEAICKAALLAVLDL